MDTIWRASGAQQYAREDWYTAQSEAHSAWERCNGLKDNFKSDLETIRQEFEEDSKEESEEDSEGKKEKAASLNLAIVRALCQFEEKQPGIVWEQEMRN